MLSRLFVKRLKQKVLKRGTMQAEVGLELSLILVTLKTILLGLQIMGLIMEKLIQSQVLRLWMDGNLPPSIH
jgi:hypothetical protein